MYIPHFIALSNCFCCANAESSLPHTNAPHQDSACGIQMSYSSDQQDEMTRTAQAVLRLMGHGAVKEILGLDGQDVPGRTPVAQCAGHSISKECPTLLAVGCNIVTATQHLWVSPDSD